MNVFGMVVAIVALSMGTSIILKYLKLREKQITANENGSEADDRYKALEERVRVLEKIATDKSHKLSEEIDAL